MLIKKEFIAGSNDEGRRLDRVLRILLGGLPLSAIYGGLRRRRILVNGKKAEPSYLVQAGDRIEADQGLVEGQSRPRIAPSFDITLSATSILPSLEAMILFQTRDIVFLNKPRGLATHGTLSLDTLVRQEFYAKGEASLAFAPGPLHRLDRNTSGMVAFSLSIRGAHSFTAALREGLVQKSYVALLDGNFEGEERWEDLLTRSEDSLKTGVSNVGETAISHAKALAHSTSRTLALVTIKTGRTHQIRAQASAHGHPLSGDRKYGGRELEGGYILHAWRLEFFNSILPGLPALLTAPLPQAAKLRLVGEFGVEALDILGM